MFLQSFLLMINELTKIKLLILKHKQHKILVIIILSRINYQFFKNIISNQSLYFNDIFVSPLN
ncbi:hypothetical protein M153_4240003766 [Pseudoloma neurophilia]|uniref:Uncharacterized protein n=1 Tax=Pseudoloma neurophilia TaxID=146866 RepID=A0A0R0M6F4_9MICR|nr:hypothetical protein M153_4240003766 [Pseudoloma neurophilia]